MKQIALHFAEPALLFAALFFTLPYIPSNELARLPLLPGAAFACALFAGSRLIRWRTRYVFAAAETLTFAVFARGANAVANILYGAS